MAGVCFLARRLFSSSTTRQIKLVCESSWKSSSLLESKSVGSIASRNIYKGAYDAEGKTIGFIINKKSAEVLCVAFIHCHGFILANEEEYEGPIIMFPGSVLSWHVNSSKDIDEESLVLFKVLEPKLDILILGYGTKKDYTPEIQKKFSGICKNLGIRFEALPTEQACGLFNFLAAEQRLVAGAFIPPTSVDVQRLSKKLSIDVDDDEDKDQPPSDFELLDKKISEKKYIK